MISTALVFYHEFLSYHDAYPIRKLRSNAKTTSIENSGSVCDVKPNSPRLSPYGTKIEIDIRETNANEFKA